jgi:glycine/D-amino acid oxidase-like deaminating enzyme/nitrite reductase/ring-hydroxylating ferredoxin subunit
MSTTGSIWSDNLPPRTGDALDADTTCDVCVIGAGIAGLTTAYRLTKEGRSVLVLEARPKIAAGETEYTTAHLASVIDDRFARLESVRGTDVAKIAYWSHATAIDAIEEAATVDGINCDFTRLDGYLFPGKDARPEDLHDEEHSAHAAGVAVRRVEAAPLPRNPVGPALRFPRQARFHPLKYLIGLAKAITANGGRIVTDCRVSKVEGGERPVVHTADEKTVTASAVVVATNSPVNSGVLLSSKIAAYTTYAIAAEVPRGSVPDALYWDTEDPYHYVRLHTVRDGTNVRDVLIVGGEDHKTGQDAKPEDHWGRLEAWAKERFPLSGPVEWRWSGEVFETLDGLALIGPDPEGKENVYIATGDSGMGMTHGTIAGLLLTDLIQGRSNPWADAYSPKRSPVAAAWTYLSENLNVAGQYADWVRAGDSHNPEDVPCGQGIVVRRGLSKIALYRDDEGKVHEMSAVCPHLGCVVRWNGAEQTWDCPCHGSRFAADGKMIHGPATDDLKPLNAVAMTSGT